MAAKAGAICLRRFSLAHCVATKPMALQGVKYLRSKGQGSLLAQTVCLGSPVAQTVCPGEGAPDTLGKGCRHL